MFDPKLNKVTEFATDPEMRLADLCSRLQSSGINQFLMARKQSMITKYKFISIKDFLSGIDETESINQDYDADEHHDFDYLF